MVRGGRVASGLALEPRPRPAGRREHARGWPVRAATATGDGCARERDAVFPSRSLSLSTLDRRETDRPLPFLFLLDVYGGSESKRVLWVTSD